MADAVLHVKVDPSGAVAGAGVAAASLDKLTAAAARSAASSSTLTSAFLSTNTSARTGEAGLRSMLREQTGLARAYAMGSEAVKQYNLQLKIEAVLAEAGVAANTMRGRAIAAQVVQLEALIVANEAAAVAQREADAAAGSMAGGLSGMAMKAFGAVAVLGVLKTVVMDFAHAAMEAEDAERRLASAVERKGDSFRMSTADLVKMATKLEQVTTFEDDAIQKAQAILLRFDEIDASNIERVTAATLDFAEATGQDAASAATAFGKALLVPGEAMRALKEVGITLTQQQQDMVDAWNSTGQGAKSVSLLVGMMNDKIGGEARDAATTGAGGLKQFSAALGNLKEALGAGLIPNLSFLTTAMQGLVAVAQKDNRGLFKAFFLSGDELHEWYLAKVAADDLAVSLKLVGDNGRHAQEAAPFVKPKTKEELDAAAAAAKEYAAKLQAVLDKADPFGAKQREMAANVALLKEAFKALNVPLADQPRMLAQLTGDWSNYADGIKPATIELLEVTSALEQWQKANAGGTKGKPAKDTNVGKLTIDRVEIPETAYEQAFTDLKSNLQGGVTGAFSYGIAAFLSGSKDATQQFGDALKNVMLNAVSEYLSKMLLMLAKELAYRLMMVAKEAAARRAANAGSSASGGGGMGGIMQMFGGGGGGAATGMSSGMVALGAWVAVAAAAVAVLKHQVDRANAVRYQTTVMYSSSSGSTTVGGKLMETGGKIADAFKALINEIQSSTGALLEGAHKAAIAVRNDKQGFRALVDGVVIGTFKTMDEAIVAAMKKLFSADNLKNQMDPIVQQVVNNFDASKGPQAFAEAVKSVTQIVNSLSGLTDIEIQLRDLPANADQLAAKLHEMGVSIADAGIVAAKWTVQQLQSIRDQITGHEASAAEQLAERQRQAVFFNAQLVLNKANMAMKKAEIEHDIEVLKNRISVTNTKYELDKWQLEREREFAMQGAEIAQYELDVRAAAGEASITLLQAQLEAINQSMAALETIKPISMGEIHLPGNGGGGGSAGPSERQQRQEAFNEFLEQQSMSALSDYQRGLAELNKAFDEQVRASREVAGGEEKLAAARSAALHQLAADLIDSFGLPMETARDRAAEFAQKVSDVKAAFAAGQISFDEFLAWFEELGLMARSELLGMAVYFTDAMGDAVESAKMRKELAQLEWDLKKAEFRMALNMYHLSGAISDADFERWNNFVNNLPDAAPAAGTAAGAGMDLASQAQWFADAMGDTKESVRLQKELADMEWTLKVAAYDLALETYFLNEQITKAQYEAGKSLVERLGDFKPSEHWAENGGSSSSSSGPDPRDAALDALTRALDRLRGIMQTYTDFLRGLQTSESSPYSIEQQYNTAQAEYQRLLALAQAGNLDAMEALPNAAQTYLDLAAQMFGTASAGYAQIFEGINSDMTGIMGGIQQILDAVPSQYRPMEERLDTIAEILQNMYLLAGGANGNGTSQDPHAGLVYYGYEWGWHPMGWSPGGQAPPDPLAGGTRGAVRGASLSHANGSLTEETNRHLRAIVDLQAKALRDGASDRVRKPKLSYAGYTGGRTGAARKS